MIRFNMPIGANRAAPFIHLEKGPKLRVRAPRAGEVRAPRAGEVPAHDKPEQVLVLEPQTTPKAGSGYRLKVAAGTLAASGNLGTAEEKTCDLTVPGSLRLVGLEKSQAHDPGLATTRCLPCPFPVP